MTISFPIAGVTNNGTSRSPAFTLGTAPAAGDVIDVFISSVNIFAITDVAGWPNVVAANTVISSDSHTACMFTHEVTPAEAGAATVTWTLTNLLNVGDSWRITATVAHGDAGPLSVSGAAGTGFSSVNTATPFVIPSVTPAHDNAQVIAGLVADSAAITQTTPAGWTQRAVGGSNYLYSRDALGSNGVATGTTNVTPSTGDEYIGIAVAIREAVVVWAPPRRPAPQRPQPVTAARVRRLDPAFLVAAPVAVAPYVRRVVTPRPVKIAAIRARRLLVPLPSAFVAQPQRRPRPTVVARSLLARRLDPAFVVAAPAVAVMYVPTVGRHPAPTVTTPRARQLFVPFPATFQHNALVVPVRAGRAGPRARPLLVHRLDPAFVVAAPVVVAPYVARAVTPRPTQGRPARTLRLPVPFPPTFQYNALVPLRAAQRPAQRPTVGRTCRQTTRTPAPYVPVVWPPRAPTTTRRAHLLPSRHPRRRQLVVAATGAGAPVISGPYHPVRMAWHEPAASHYREPDAMGWHEPLESSYREPPATSWHEPDGEP